MGVDFIHFVQGFQSSLLDQSLIWITDLNSEQFYIIVLPLIYWVVSRELGLRLSLMLLTAALTNTMLKEAFALPRPSEAEGVRILHAESGGNAGFPSGHAQDTTAVWGYLAARYGPGRRLWYWIAGAVVLLVGLSRIYLGLHYPRDILGGIFFGLLLVGAARWLERRGRYWRLSAGARWLLPVVPLVALPLVEDPFAFRIVGFLVGAIGGYLLDLEFVRFATRSSIGGHVIKLVLGYGGFMGLRVATSPLFPEGILQVVRYGLLGLWITAVAPALFRALGLVKD